MAATQDENTVLFTQAAAAEFLELRDEVERRIALPNLATQETSSTSLVDELAKLGDLRDRGILTDEEFAAQKAIFLGRSPGAKAAPSSQRNISEPANQTVASLRSAIGSASSTVSPTKSKGFGVGKILGFGCLGLIGLMVLLSAIGSAVGEKASSLSSDASNQTEESSAPIAEQDGTATSEIRSNWIYSETNDAMRNATLKFARLNGENELDFSFPYGSGNSTQLVVQQRPEDGLSVFLEIEKGQFLCRSFGDSAISVKFDEGRVERFRCTDTSDGSSNIAFILPANQFLNKLRRSKKLVIEAEFFREGNRQIIFNTDGLNW